VTDVSAAWWFTLAALCFVLLAPLSLTDVPPLLDYPNHLARLFILANSGDPTLSRFWQPHWAIIPNLALDLAVPPLMHILPVHMVGRMVLGVLIVLPVLGAAAYHRALTGRLSFWPLGSTLFVYNAEFLRGFLNFIASVGIALLLGAVWMAWRESRAVRTILISAAGAVALFFCHLVGLVFFAILIGGHELAALRDAGFRAGALLKRAIAAAAVFVIPLMLYASSGLRHTDSHAAFRDIGGKAHIALTPVINYVWPLDLMSAALCVAVPLWCLSMRWCRVPLQAAVTCIALLALFAALPFAFKGTFDLDTRFIVMAAFTIPGAMVPIAPPPRALRAIASAFLLLFAVRMAVVMVAWGHWSHELAAFREVTAQVQPGDAVMTVAVHPGNRSNSFFTGATPRRLSDNTPVDGHLPALLVIEHHAWWPFLFDDPSQQPIESREPYRTAGDLIDRSRDPLALLAARPPELSAIDKVLVLGAEPTSIDTNGLKLLADNDSAALFAVVRGGATRPGPLAPPSAR
jgi:hypothetical protein